MVTATKNVDTDFCPLLVSRYVSIQFGITLLSTNMVAGLVNVTVVTGMGFSDLFLWL